MTQQKELIGQLQSLLLTTQFNHNNQQSIDQTDNPSTKSVSSSSNFV